MTILGAELSPLSDSVPVIIEVYDLLSGKHDGTITPWAPIIVSGSRLDMYARDTVRLCLVFRNRRKAGHRDRAYL